MKIEGVAFGLTKDLYNGGIYIPPSQSTYTKTVNNNGIELFNNIEEDVAYLQTKGHVVALGDFNARTGNIQDFHYNSHNLRPEGDDLAKLPNRCSKDNNQLFRASVGRDM